MLQEDKWWGKAEKIIKKKPLLSQNMLFKM